LKVLEGDEELVSHFNISVEIETIKRFREHIEKVYGEDLESFLADVRYGLASGVVRQVLSRPEIRKITFTEKVDKWALNRYPGIPLFLFIMWLLF